MKFSDLTPQQQAKLNEGLSTEELLALAKAEGVELSDIDLERIAGGRSWNDDIIRCEACGKYHDYELFENECPFCGHVNQQ